MRDALGRLCAPRTGQNHPAGAVSHGGGAYHANMDDHRPDPAEERRPEERAADTSATDDDAALGGDETTEEQLDADNEVEADALKSLNPDDAPA